MVDPSQREIGHFGSKDPRGRSHWEIDLSQKETGHFGATDPRGRFNWGRDSNRLRIGHLEARGRSHRRSSMMT